jgi:hypothetical protein
MAYRFTQTEKWTDSWFSQLTPLQMLLFIYLCDNCDIAGFINVNIKRWASDLNSEQSKILGALEALGRGLIYSTNKEIIFIKNFLKHQKNYPINPNNNAHLGIIKRFEACKIYFEVDTLESLLSLESLGATEGLPSPYGKGNGSGSSNGVFDFKQSLINLGATEQHASDMMKARNKKKLVNTESALNLFINQAKQLNMTIAEAVEYCAGRSWGGLRVEYVKKDIGAQQLNYLSGPDETDLVNQINAITDPFQLDVALSKFQYNDQFTVLYHTELQKFISWDTMVKCPKIGKVARKIFTAKSIDNLLTPATYGQRVR